MSNYTEYQKSISNELISIKDRVRNIIDNHHWGEEGRYKEVILAAILRKHLPKSVSVGTGFIMTSDGPSTQIDIIIYRNDFPVIFQQDDFVIVTPEAVLGIVEVKSAFHDTTQFRNAIEKVARNTRLTQRGIFSGIFAFERDPRLTDDAICNTMRESLPFVHGDVNHICIGENIFVKHWWNRTRRSEGSFSIYRLRQLAFGYFISNLVEHVFNDVTGLPLPDALRSMCYPIEKTKEAHVIRTVSLDQNW